MPEWLFPILSFIVAVVGSFIGVKVGLARQEEKHIALDKRVDEHVEAMSERMKILGDRSHTHADRLTEHGMRLHDLSGRVLRLERLEDER
jgi:hypothetical protein